MLRHVLLERDSSAAESLTLSTPHPRLSGVPDQLVRGQGAASDEGPRAKMALVRAFPCVLTLVAAHADPLGERLVAVPATNGDW